MCISAKNTNCLKFIVVYRNILSKITSSCPSDYNFKLTANGDDITNTKKFVSKNQNVPLQASISNYYIYDDKEGFYYLNDGSGDTVLNKVSITFKITKPDGSLSVTAK